MPFPWFFRKSRPKPTPSELDPEKLAAAAMAILGADNPVDICKQLTDCLTALIQANQTSILLLDQDQGCFNIAMSNGHISGNVEKVSKELLEGVAGEAYRKGEPVVKVDEEGYSRAQIAVPIKVRDGAIGVVAITGERRPFTTRETGLASFLTAQAASALQTARLDRADLRRREVTEALIQAGRELTGNINPIDLPGRILEQLERVVPYERGSLMLEEESALRIAAQRGFPKDERTQRLRMVLREGDVYYQIASSHRPVLIEDVTQEAGWQQVPWLPLNLSWLGVPLFSRDRVIGMVSLTRKERAAFSQDDVLMAMTFALNAAGALENATLYEEITRFNQQLEAMVKQRTIELEQALHDLERMDKNKSSFIEVTAHELRTPITVMKGYMGMMQSDATIRANPFLLQGVEGIMKGTDRLHEVVNSMLDVARIDSQVLNVIPEMVAISTIAKRILSDLTNDLETRHQALYLKALDRLPTIHADPTLMLKAFQALVFNAVKYTPDGGSITISGKPVTDDERGECVEVMIQDTGIGIDPEHQELIFEKFYRLGEVATHSSGKTNYKGGGPGLGLAIARGIIEAHGGRVWVISEGQDEVECPGSCFHVLLPVRLPVKEN